MTNEQDKQDALRWRFVRDHGLVHADRSFGSGCLPGRVGDMYATEFVDEQLRKGRLSNLTPKPYERDRGKGAENAGAE